MLYVVLSSNAVDTLADSWIKILDMHDFNASFLSPSEESNSFFFKAFARFTNLISETNHKDGSSSFEFDSWLQGNWLASLSSSLETCGFIFSFLDPTLVYLVIRFDKVQIWRFVFVWLALCGDQ